MQYRNNISIVAHDECVGCGACVAVCQKRCITMQQDGIFYYPIVDEAICVNCGKCIKSCPARSISVPNEENTPKSKYFCSWNKDANKRKASTSGGVGSAIAQYAISSKYVVCGVALDSNQEVRHIISDGPEVVDLIRGSKYVQSKLTSEIYHQLLSYIESGRKVLFIGTPCQVSAVQNMVPDRLKELMLTCEIVCHGVNSPVVWKDFVNDIQCQYRSHIKNYNFRSKSKGWGKLRVSAEFENGKRFDVPAWKNLFHVWFGRHYILRESCQHCRYRKINRQADITIGDFWGIEKIEPTVDYKDGASVLIARTPKAEAFLGKIPNLYMKEVDAVSTSRVLKGYIEKRSEEIIQHELMESRAFVQTYTQNEGGYKICQVKYPCPTLYDLIKASIKFRLHKYLKI